MKNKGLTISIAFQAQSGNYGEGIGNISQPFVNRSTVRGGSTIGPISASHVSIPSVDIGVPMLAMHSVRELCGVKDNYYMLKALETFFACNK